MSNFAAAFERKAIAQKVDPLAQSVEHNTFNVGVLGSNPKRITKSNRQVIGFNHLSIFLYLRCATFAPLDPYNKPEGSLTIKSYSFFLRLRGEGVNLLGCGGDEASPSYLSPL